MLSWSRGALGSGCSAAKWMTTSKVQYKFQWPEFFTLRVYWVTFAGLLTWWYARQYSPLGKKTSQSNWNAYKRIRWVWACIHGNQGILFPNGHQYQLAALSPTAFLQASPLGKKPAWCLPLLEITNHNFLFANKKVGAHSIFEKGHRTGRLTFLLTNTYSGKCIHE